MKDRRGWQCLLGAAAAALVLVFAVAACGGEEKKSDSGQPAPAAGAAAVSDACKVVTQEDATKLFGKTASPQKGQMVLDPSMMSECIWTWDSPEADNQLLQFSIWNGEQYYDDTFSSGEQPIDLGKKGHIRVHSVAGVDIQWIQDGKTLSLSYSTVGSGVPDPTAKVEEVKALARKVEKEL